MKNELLAKLIASALLLAQSVFAADVESGFKPIFNDKDLSGWDGNPKLWSVKDSAIVGRTTAEAPIKGNTFLIWTNGTVGDFELRCSFKIEPNNDAGFANSGIQYRSKILDPANWVVGGYQADMEAGPTYTGILYEERMTRGIMAARGEKVLWDKTCQKQVLGSLGKSEDLQAAIKKADWNDYVIIAQGNHLQHFINGKQTVDVTDDCEAKRAMNGVLALQLHAGQAMSVQFRNIRLKTLKGETSSSAEEIKKLQGVWNVIGAEANGDQVPQEDVTNIVVTITDSTYTAKLNEGTDHGTFSIDVTAEPKQMDIHPKSGEDEGRTMRAIYEVKGDTLRVCYARQGGPRPSAFDTSGDAGLLLINYKRKQN
jgi:uncharacterized protein (TIGR03067 family)